MNSKYSFERLNFYCRYAGLAMGICNTFANIPGMVVPSIVEAMTPNVSKSSTDISMKNASFLKAVLWNCDVKAIVH